MNYFAIQTSMIFRSASYQRCMQSIKQTKGYLFHGGIVVAVWRNCQGVANAVSVATGSSQERSEMTS
jgi:hypothetical protein